MKIKLVFVDWQHKGKSIYNTENGVSLSMGDFHSGTTFNGTIELNDEQAEDLLTALKHRFEPVFAVVECHD